MKRLFALLLAIIFIFSLSACDNTKTALSDPLESEPLQSEIESTTSSDEISSENASSSTDTLLTESEPSNVLESQPASSNNTTTSSSAITDSSKEESSSQVTSASSQPESSAHPSSSINSSSAPESSSQSVVSNSPNHTHTFSNATCTEPKKCSCGATEGKALGHKWKIATCKSPKTCSVCSQVSGTKANHSFSNGICSLCNEKDPTYHKLQDGYWYAYIEFPTYITMVSFDFGKKPMYGYAKANLANLETDKELEQYFGVYNGKTYVFIPSGDSDIIEYTVSGTTVVITYKNKKLTLNRTSNNELKVTQVDSGFLDYGIDVITLGTNFKFNKYSD